METTSLPLWMRRRKVQVALSITGSCLTIITIIGIVVWSRRQADNHLPGKTRESNVEQVSQGEPPSGGGGGGVQTVAAPRKSSHQAVSSKVTDDEEPAGQQDSTKESQELKENKGEEGKGDDSLGKSRKPKESQNVHKSSQENHVDDASLEKSESEKSQVGKSDPVNILQVNNKLDEASKKSPSKNEEANNADETIEVSTSFVISDYESVVEISNIDDSTVSVNKNPVTPKRNVKKETKPKAQSGTKEVAVQLVTEAKKIAAELEVKVKDQKSKEVIKGLIESLEKSPELPPPDAFICQLMQPSKTFEEKEAAFEALSEIIEKQEQIPNSQKFQLSVTKAFIKKKFLNEKVTHLKSKISSNPIKRLDVFDIFNDLSNLKDEKEVKAVEDFLEAKAQSYEAFVECRTLRDNDKNSTDASEIKNSLLQYNKYHIDEVEQVSFALKFHQLEKVLGADPHYQKLKAARMELDPVIIKQLLQDQAKYGELLDILEGFYKHETRIYGSHKIYYSQLRALRTLSKLEGQSTLKDIAERLYNAFLEKDADSSKLKNVQEDIDVLMKTLKGAGMSKNFEEFRDILGYALYNYPSYYQSLLRVVEYSFRNSEYSTLMDSLDGIFQKIVKNNEKRSLVDILPLIDRLQNLQTDLNLPVFLFHLSESIKLRLVEPSKEVKNMFEISTVYASLQLQLNLENKESLANRLRWEAPTARSTKNSLRLDAYKTVVQKIIDCDPEYTESVGKIFEIAIVPFLKEKIAYHMDINNGDSIVANLNRVAQKLGVTHCLNDMNASNMDFRAVENCITTDVKLLGDQVDILSLLFQLHTIYQMSIENLNFETICGIASSDEQKLILEMMHENPTPKKLNALYVRVVRDERPISQMFAKARRQNPQNLEDVMLMDPLRMNPNYFDETQLPQTSKKLWNDIYKKFVNQSFVDRMTRLFPDSTPPLNEAVKWLNDSIVSSVKSDRSWVIHKTYSNYLRLAFVVSRSFELAPFDLDPQQEEVLKDFFLGHRLLPFLM